MASGSRSHNLVEPSTSVNSNVTVPSGSPVIDSSPNLPGAFPTRRIMGYPAPHGEIRSISAVHRGSEAPMGADPASALNRPFCKPHHQGSSGGDHGGEGVETPPPRGQGVDLCGGYFL